MGDQLASAALPEMLAPWLPRQRWFPGGGAAVDELDVISDTTLVAGDPRLRHVIVEVKLPAGPARFQVLVGSRSDLPPSISGADHIAVIGMLPGLAVYDALYDPELATELLRRIADQQHTGLLRAVREPTALLGDWRSARVLTAEQSNTSLVFDDAAILKVLRRLFPGANPDLEVADALAKLGSDRVAAPFGWIETELDGQPVLLAVLSEYLANARDGWALALDSVQELYARHGGGGADYVVAPLTPAGAAERAEANGAGTGMPFVSDAWQLGLATAQLHADMATAFGTRDMTEDELAAFARTLTRKLTDAVATVPELAEHAERIAAAYDDVAQIRGPVQVQRIHGDYHLGQVMYGKHGWVALDFEGEPAAPLAERRALAPALRDVAGMLRSFDYAARQPLVGHSDRAGLLGTASAWARQCQDAFCAGYSGAGGADPTDQATLLRALTLEKAVYEVIYEYRHRPAWLPIPLDYVAAG